MDGSTQRVLADFAVRVPRAAYDMMAGWQASRQAGRRRGGGGGGGIVCRFHLARF